MDWYKVLGVSRNADESEIKRAYKALARQYHPDANPGNEKAEEKFKDVVKAYDVLSNPKKRKTYDADYMRSKTANEKKRNEGWGVSFRTGKENPIDVTDMFEAFMKLKR